ncbi:hypothetical protein [Moraxella lacunata]
MRLSDTKPAMSKSLIHPQSISDTWGCKISAKSLNVVMKNPS